MPKVLDPKASYTFHSYFEMRYNIADILADLGFGYDRRRLDLPSSDRNFSVARIEATLERNLRYADPSSEAARREILWGGHDGRRLAVWGVGTDCQTGDPGYYLVSCPGKRGAIATNFNRGFSG